MNVRFFAGSKKQYLDLDSYSPLALYFCYDTRELFWGDLLLSDGMRVVTSYEALPAMAEAADGVIYFVTETRNGYVLSNDRTEWIQVIQSPSGGSGDVVDLDNYFTKDETATAINSAIAELNIPTIEGLATEEYVDKAIAALPEHEETDLTGYATQQWVIDQGYLTNHIDINGKADIDHKHDDLYEAKGAADAIKNEILNGAGEAYDTLKELSDLIADNKDTIEVLETVATGKADKEHTHEQYLTEHQSLDGYAKKEELFSGSYSDLTDKPEIPSIEGLATEAFVNDAISNIESSDTEIYKVDFNAPDYDKALEAYNNGKVLVLINAAPDTNSYAVMNYVSEKYITFAKFLTSRSTAYGSFNTYYLSPANTWEVSKEVRLNKVEANVEGEVSGELSSIRIGKEVYSLPNTNDLASKEYVDTAIAGIELPEPEKVDLTGYATEQWVKDQEYLTEHQDLSGKADVDHKHSEYLTEHQSLEGYAKTEDIPTDYLTEADLEGYSKFSGSYNDLTDTPEIPSIEGLATLEQLQVKADNIPFTTSKIVGKAAGGFAIGDDIKDMSIAEILAKLLELSDGSTDDPELPEEPNGVIETIMVNKIPMYAVTVSGSVEEVPYKLLSYTEDAAKAEPTESGFYQIKDAEGNVLESGYQELQASSDETYYVIALPKEIDYTTMVTTQLYSDSLNTWLPAENFEFTSDPDTVAAICDDGGVDISGVDQSVYTIWAAETFPTGSKLRFIITE